MKKKTKKKKTKNSGEEFIAHKKNLPKLTNKEIFATIREGRT